MKDEKLLFKLIRAAFMERRKTLLNAVKNSQELDIPKERVEEVLTDSTGASEALHNLASPETGAAQEEENSSTVA